MVPVRSEWSKRILRFISGLGNKRRPLPIDRLTEEERCFLDALNQTLHRQDAAAPMLAMTDSRVFPPRLLQNENGLLVLVPRQHEAIVKIMRDVLSDPAFIPPALALLNISDN
jgi:hypothetical protein